jgi:glyoxylase-like metal-dependent hydrolase (beta-lactamase superfamily II)
MQAYHIVGEAPLYTNTFVLISDAHRAVIIDPAAAAEKYEAVLAEQNATLAAIFCTHGHYDHVGSAEALRARTGATLYCETADAKGDQMFPLDAARIDRGYAEGESIAVDELQFTVWHTPGHTPGSVCLLCENYFFTGDTLFAGSMGRTDLPGGSEATMRESLRKLAALPVPKGAQVLPGHGEFSTYAWEMQNNHYVKSACAAGR